MKTLHLHDSFRFKAPVVVGAAPNPAANNGLRRITVVGRNFFNAPSVTVSGVPATAVQLLSDSTLTCLPPAGTVGVKDLVLTNPDGQNSGTSGNGSLSFSLWPHITAITPNSGTAVGGTPVTIDGSGFVSGCTVTIGGAAATSVVFVNVNQITCVTPLRTSGVKDVIVTNPDASESGTSGTGLYTYTLPFDPTTFVLSSYQRDYDAAAAAGTGNWLGTASAGISALHKEVQLTTMPPVGDPLPLSGISGCAYRQSGRNTRTVRVSDDGSVVAETLVANTAYTASFFVDFMEAKKDPGTIYLRSTMLQADAHWGWGFRSTASLVGQSAITISASAGTIVQSGGLNFVTSGFLAGQTVYLRRTVSNNGFVAATLLSVTTTTLTFNSGHGLVNESLILGDDPAISAGPYFFHVFNYTGAFPFVEVATTPGLHWYYVRRTASGTIQIDIDGVAGTPTALTDHIGASGIAMQSNAAYGGNMMTFTEYERFTALVSQSDSDRNNYRLYLNARYGTAY